MDVRVFSVLVLGMQKVQAQEHFKDMQAAGYPHMKDEERGKYHNSWKERAFKDELDEKVVKTTDLRMI